MSEILTLPKSNTKRDFLTYENYVTFPDQDGIKKEIIEGELYMTPAPATKHQIVSRNLFRFIDDYVVKHDLGEVLFAPCDVILSNFNIIQPDILFIAKENYTILKDQNIQGAPDLIIEILSPASIETDRIQKKLIYEKFGVKEYWIVDPQNRSIEVWILKDKKYQLYFQTKKDQYHRSQLFRDLKIDLVSIFK